MQTAVRTILRERAPRGAAPGLSGRTEALLLVDNPTLLLNLTCLLEDIACGRASPDLRARLLSCRLIPAKKKDDGIRPIAISEVFLRLASSLTLRLLEPLRTFLPAARSGVVCWKVQAQENMIRI